MDSVQGKEEKRSDGVEESTRPKTPTKAETEILPTIEPQQPTEEELKTLRHIPDTLPWGAWLVVLFSSLERFSYFGFVGPLRRTEYLRLRVTSTDN